MVSLCEVKTVKGEKASPSYPSKASTQPGMRRPELHVQLGCGLGLGGDAPLPPRGAPPRPGAPGVPRY